MDTLQIHRPFCRYQQKGFAEREMLRLQGFPDSYKIVCNYSQTRKQAGNSVTVPAIEAIARNMLQAMGIKKEQKRREEGRANR